MGPEVDTINTEIIKKKIKEVNIKFNKAKQSLASLEEARERLSKEILWLQGEHRALSALIK